MTVKPNDAGAPPNDAANPVDTGTGEPGAGGERTDEQKAEYHKRQALEHKTKAEALNALMERYGVSTVEELNERMAQSPAAPAERVPVQDDDGDETEDERRAVEKFIAEGDPVAKRMQRLERRIEQLTRGVGDAFVARDVPDPAERKLAMAHYEKNKHRLGDFTAALAEVRVSRLQRSEAGLRAELAALRKQPDPDVLNAPKTHGREIAVTESPKKKMTGAQYDSELAALWDAGSKRAALDMEAAYARGDIVVQG